MKPNAMASTLFAHQGGVVPVGTMGDAISRRVRSRRAAMPPKVAGQIETPRLPDPIMRRPCANHEEKQVTYGNG
jgi:hypothetical protein